MTVYPIARLASNAPAGRFLFWSRELKRIKAWASIFIVTISLISVLIALGALTPESAWVLVGIIVIAAIFFAVKLVEVIVTPQQRSATFVTESPIEAKTICKTEKKGEANDNMMARVSHIRQVKPQDFADWLERYLHPFSVNRANHLPYLKGDIQLLALRRYGAPDKPSKVVIPGVYSYWAERNGQLVSGGGGGSEDYIVFHLVTLDEKRTEITTECEGIPSIEAFTQNLLVEISKRWPAEGELDILNEPTENQATPEQSELIGGTNGQTSASPNTPPAPTVTPSYDAISGQANQARECFIFQKKGEIWVIAYRRGEEFGLNDTKGLSYIAHLLRNPQRYFTPLELVSCVGAKSSGDISTPYEGMSEAALAEEGLNTDEAGVGELVLDDRAKSEYKERLEALAEERKQAEAAQDSSKLDNIDREEEQIQDELNACTGLGGRGRRFSSPTERARVAVRSRIADSLKRIYENDAVLGEHLKASIQTGSSCSYRPDPDKPIAWTF